MIEFAQAIKEQIDTTRKNIVDSNVNDKEVYLKHLDEIGESIASQDLNKILNVIKNLNDTSNK